MSNSIIETSFKINNVEYNVNHPGSKENKIAQLEYNKTFGELVKAGAVLRAKLSDYMQEQGIWTAEKQQKLFDLVKDITEGEKKLETGGIKLKEAVKIAKEIKGLRLAVQKYLVDKSVADSNTAEGQAENARFQKLLTLCLVYKTDGKVVFPTLESLLNETDETQLKVAEKGFEILNQILYKADDNYESTLIENKFLKEWGFVDDKLRYINEKGQLVDEGGRLINEEGQLINEKGELVDGNSNRVNERGEPIVPESEKKPFLDDDGNPLVPPKKD